MESRDVFGQGAISPLIAEWSDLIFREGARQDAEQKALVARWSSRLPGLRTRYEDLIEAGLWLRGPADFFGIVGLSRSEVHHSAMIAWLLDPTGRHGLGVSFLSAVVESLFVPDSGRGLRVQKVACEVARGDTRADIIVWADGMTLVIENKVDAEEGFRQCDRLYDKFASEPGPLFLFLSPTGRRPETATGDAAESFRALSYRTLIKLIEDSIPQASQQKSDGLNLVENYLSTLKEQFG